MKRAPLKHQAYEMIKNNIVNCVYAPGTVINEELIREEIDASRTPIRDALSRLEQEGLVKILPKKGILVTQVTMKELNMIYETRDLLEPYAVKNYGNRIPQETYMKYYQMYSGYLKNPGQAYSFTEMDESFHQMLMEATENSYFLNIYSTIESQIRRTRVLTGRTSTERLCQTMEEHLAIVKAALKKDWEEAAEAMRSHLNQSKNSYFNYIWETEQNPADTL